jgi:hypothetical protein
MNPLGKQKVGVKTRGCAIASAYRKTRSLDRYGTPLPIHRRGQGLPKGVADSPPSTSARPRPLAGLIAARWRAEPAPRLPAMPADADVGPATNADGSSPIILRRRRPQACVRPRVLPKPSWKMIRPIRGGPRTVLEIHLRLWRGEQNPDGCGAHVGPSGSQRPLSIAGLLLAANNYHRRLFARQASGMG